VAELAAAMGAGVRAESPVADGRGTRMVVWFPPGTGPAEPSDTPTGSTVRDTVPGAAAAGTPEAPPTEPTERTVDE